MRTPFYECHKKYGGKIVDFHGWDLPIQFEGIVKEHQTVREKSGLFDVSHMGEIIIKGQEAAKFTDFIVTNSVYKMNINDAIYTTMCRSNGTVVDDLLVYKMSEDEFFLVVNASNIEKDFNHILKESRNFKTEVKNVSENYAQLAVQGPTAAFVVNSLISENICVDEIGFFKFRKTVFAGVEAIVSRTGYTTEDGFEIYFTDLSQAEKVWEAIIEAGKEFGLKPIGLGARDTLRFEGCLMLYGNELDDETTPLEARLNWAVDFEKEFLGKEELLKQKLDGIKKKLVGVEITEKAGIARHGYEVFDKDKNKTGYVTSGSKSHTLDRNLALAYVNVNVSKPGNEIYIKIRDKYIMAKVVKIPFYRRPESTVVKN